MFFQISPSTKKNKLTWRLVQQQNSTKPGATGHFAQLPLQKLREILRLQRLRHGKLLGGSLVPWELLTLMEFPQISHPK
jgi:hypothetical protein